MTTKGRTTRKRKTVSAAALKRQIAALKIENDNLKKSNDTDKSNEIPIDLSAADVNPGLSEVNPGLADVNPQFATPDTLVERAPLEDDLLIEGTDAKNNRFILTDTFETEEHTVGQDHPRDMKSTGPASESLEPALIEAVDRPVSQEKLAMLAFMEENVMIRVHDSSNPTDEQTVAVWNDGRAQYFIRGQVQKVKRKFIEVLARAKLTTYSQQKQQDSEGNESYRQVPHTVLRFPFSVIRDDHPRGGDWLESILAEA